MKHYLFIAAGLAVAAATLGHAGLAGANDAPALAAGQAQTTAAGVAAAAAIASNGWTMEEDCAKPEVRVVLVGGKVKPGSSLIIGGCGFGGAPGQAYLMGSFPQGKTKLVIDSWTHKGIGAHVADVVAGAQDQVATLRIVTKAGAVSNTDKKVFYDDGY